MKNKKKLLVLAPYPFDHAPSQRLKFEQYFNEFRAAGYEITMSSFITPAFWKVVYKKNHNVQKFGYTLAAYFKRIIDLFKIPFYDIVYVHLWVTPFGLPVFEWLVRRLSKKLIYDIDDMIYLRDNKSKANPIISNLKGKNKPIYLFRNSDHIITCTPYLEEFAKKFNSQVTDIPVSIDTNVYLPRKDYHQMEDKIIIGWSGSLSTSPYVHLLDEPLKQLAKEIDFKLLIIGDKDFKMMGVDVEAIAWSKEAEMPTLKRFDIGLYPLPDEPWVYGKGGGKALQYMALGIPTVATAIGANLGIIDTGRNGFLVKTTNEWISILKELIVNQRLRESIGRAGTRTIENRYSVNANKAKYLAILDNEVDYKVDKSKLKSLL